MMMFLICVTLYPLFIHGFPTSTTSGDSPVLTFNMSETNYNQYPWTTSNASLTNISTASKTYYGDGQITCPDHVMEGNNIPLYRRSTCPWYYEVDHESTRYPTTILKARPAYYSCIGGSDQYCEPIRCTITVLEKMNTAGNVVKFVERELEIAVGFTCAGARTVDKDIFNTTAANLPTFAK